MDERGHKLEDVAKAAGVSPRTVRYYIQRGLLPQPRFRGPDTAYGEDHVVRLRAIRRLQEAFWPLDAIAGLFASKSDDDVRAIADGTSVPAPRAATLELDESGPPALPLAGPEHAPPSQRPHALGRPRVVGATGARPGQLSRRIELVDGVVLEVREPPTPDAEALVESIRALLHPPQPPRRTRTR